MKLDLDAEAFEPAHLHRFEKNREVFDLFGVWFEDHGNAFSMIPSAARWTRADLSELIASGFRPRFLA